MAIPSSALTSASGSVEDSTAFLAALAEVGIKAAVFEGSAV